jgi:lysophospholipase L1-like esterase
MACWRTRSLTLYSWLWIGTNDMIRDNCRADQVAAGIVAIVRELRQRRPDAWVVVQSLLPSEYAPVSLVEQINAATACLADSTQKTFFYNSSSVFMLPSSPGGVVNTSRFVDDGIHPNAEGSRVWGRSMLDFLRKLYEDRSIH